MPVVDHTGYCRMLDAARAGTYAYPAINVTSTDTANAAIEGFVAAKSDGIIQVSIGGGAHASGDLKDSVVGAISLAEHVHRVAARHSVNIALHTDHCQPGKVDSFLRPLIEETRRRRKAGLPNLFQSHMFDGSELPIEQNMKIAVELQRECKEADIILEVETGVVGGEEDGVSNEGAPAEKLYTTPDEMLYVWERMGEVGGRFMYAATFGNVHGVYKPGHVRLQPKILEQGQTALAAKHGKASRFDFVFHGGSGSSQAEIHETLAYGVIKMNVDTDTQYAFSRAVAHHMFTSYAGVLKVDGEVGVKKLYDPRAWLESARKSMAERVAQACADLRSAGKTLGS
jgi:fructose-bisphosphate aldolase, class II